MSVPGPKAVLTPRNAASGLPRTTDIADRPGMFQTCQQTAIFGPRLDELLWWSMADVKATTVWGMAEE
jgi:hypothetical protein